MENQIEIIKRVWKGVFGEEPEVKLETTDEENDTIAINEVYTLIKTKITVVKKSILGSQTQFVDGWSLDVAVPYHGTYWEPPDVDIHELGQHERFSNALTEMIQVEATGRANIELENITMEEMMEEREETENS